MKITLLLLTLSASLTCFSQTTVYTENFESGNSFTMNSSDLAAAYTNNTWLMNNSYSGGSGTLTCLGFPLSFTVQPTPSQPVGISGSPNSNYMHIAAQPAISSGITSASYVPADGTCFFTESNFTKMTTPVSTTGLTGVSFDFWYICGGSAEAFGEVYYSLDGGSTWILKQSTLNNTTTWTQLNLTDAAWDNQASLLFGFRFVNNTSAAGADPGFSVDEILITSNSVGCAETTSSISEIVCESYTSPSGNYTWTTSNTYMDTIPNAAGCDSVITIDLTVNATASSISETACDSYTSPSGNYTWTTSNMYMDTIPNAAGCDSVITIDLTINTVDATVSQSGIILTANETGATYAWVDCNTMTLINGETSQSFTATSNGDYAAIVTVGNCSDTSACMNVNTVGIQENDQSSLVSIYPNPSDGVFYIAVSDDAQIQVTDVSGKSILSDNYSSGQHKIDLSNFRNGIYLLKVLGNGVVSTSKIVKN